MKVYQDGKPVRVFTAHDAMALQWFPLKQIYAKELRVEMLSEYKGCRNDDLCASELIADSRVIKVYNLLDKIAKEVWVRTLNIGDLERIYQPLLKLTRTDVPNRQVAFEYAVAIFVDGKGEV